MAKTLYERAVELAQTRPSISMTNLKQSLHCTDAQAKSVLRIMLEEQVVGQAAGTLNRYPVLGYTGPRFDEETAVVNYDQPELSRLSYDIPVDMILDGEGQQQLRKAMTALVDLEARQSAITDERRLVMEIAKAKRMAPKILLKVAKALYRDKKQDLLNGINLTQVYLHALGELVEDDALTAFASEVMH